MVTDYMFAVVIAEKGMHPWAPIAVPKAKIIKAVLGLNGQMPGVDDKEWMKESGSSAL